MHLKNESGKPIYEKIWGMLGPFQKKQLFSLLVMMLLAMVLETLSIGLVIPTLSMLSNGKSFLNNFDVSFAQNFIGHMSKEWLILNVMMVFALVFLIKTLFLMALAYCQTKFAFDLQENISLRLFEIYLFQPYLFHLQKNSSELIRNATSEVSIFTNMVSNLLVLLTEGLVLLGILALILFIEPTGAILSMVVVAVLSLGFHAFTSPKIMQWGVRRHVAEGKRMQHLQQGLGGVKDIKLLGREAIFVENFGKYNQDVAISGRLQQVLEKMPRLLFELIAVLALAVIVASMVYRGKSSEAIVVALGLFAASSFRLLPSISRIFNAVQSIKYGVPAVNSLSEDFGLVKKGGNLALNCGKDIRFDRAISINNIEFTYTSANKATLMNVTMLINQGDFIGIVGESGSGKSTFIDICLGLLRPTNGVILVDNVDIHEDIRAWQSQIGYVPQSIYLTDDSLRRNIAFGVPDNEIDADQIWSAVHGAQLSGLLESLPGGLDTVIGELGSRLSGGQRQRIGIARALYHEPKILVLDEATSALDGATESEVIKIIDSLKRNKTIIMVSHRVSTLKNCDKIFEFKNGSLIGEVTYREIFNKNLN